MKIRTILASALAGLAIFAALSAKEAINIRGTWVGHLIMNDGGQDGVTLVLKGGGEEGYSGTFRDDLGTYPEGTVLQTVRFAGNKLTFTVQTEDDIPVNITLTVYEDSMLGRWDDTTNSTSGDVQLERWK
jgi:hypothetical protein